ncbi:MAG: tRNA threonylcarbamoyladenosine modification (KEOPS) complex Pcc1 subunit [Candidatus Nanohaloarchaea archaeon]|jgi:tRNA threonylcarbamoyladenosine modification (KEOPS) complex  Pcc1 subunit
MQSKVTVDSEKPEELRKVLNQSLETEGPVKHSLKTGKNSIKINTETDTLGQLRGCTDTVFRLTTLSKKILER